MNIKFTITLFLCLLISKGYTQNDTTILFNPSMKEMLNIKPQQNKEVSIASNVISDVDKQPSSVTVITAQQLKLSAARTLSEALMLFVPGYFAVEDQDDIISGFRGLAPDNNSKVLFLVNGQNLNTEFFWGPPDALLNSPNMDYIESVEVIRGPGSVVLGQGALLGVINIITKDASKEDTGSIQLNAGLGMNNFYNASMDIRLNIKGLKTYTHITGLDYHGQALRDEGWASLQGNQGFAGGKVADMGHRLRRTQNFSFINNIQYKKINFSLIQTSQKRDLYNFYRDREVLKQDLLAANISYSTNITTKISNVSTVSAIRDDYFLSSLAGVNMGGTSEVRYGLKTVFILNELFKGNKLAIGGEARVFQMGKNNSDGNNFIANKIGTFAPQTANQQLTMGYQQNITLLSMFAENFYSLNDKIDIFGAIRFDKHPFWGDNFSPRFGVIYSPTKKILFRASYQSGFRGAVGLHYSGGYRNDGFLRADNYGKVSQANIPNERNVNAIAPERINNIELATRIKFTEKLILNGTFFYNDIQNIIDVGVIYQDPNVFPMVNIGTDVPGDWNGYWYFKNTKGTFSQIGAELALAYTIPKYSIQLTQAVVQVQSATKEQKDLAIANNSMYLSSETNTDKLHAKAYPEIVTRLNILANPIRKLNCAINLMYYSDWYSPIGTKAKGGIFANVGIGYNFKNNLELNLSIKNVGNNTNLYPMNSNAGGPDVSSGTPGWESRTFWATLRMKI